MNFINKKNISLISYILIGLALASSIFLAVQRINIEKNYDQVEILVNMTEVESLANANDLSIEDVLTQFKEKGVSGVLVKELSLGDLMRTGKVQFFQGQEIKYAPYYSQMGPLEVSDADIVIVILEQNYATQIIEHLSQKLPGSEVINGEVAAVTVPVNLPNSDKEKELIYEELKAVGVGFDYEILVRSARYVSNVPQVRDWSKPTKESLEFIVKEIKRIPNISFLLFNDKQVPGYPGNMNMLVSELRLSNEEPFVPIGIVEFFNQKGINQFATLNDKETVRVHSIAANDMVNYNPKSAVERFQLAVEERNMRALFVRFFNMDQPAKALDMNLQYIKNLKDTLENEGYSLGYVEQFKSPTYSRIIIGLIGLGVIAGSLLILVRKGWLLLSLLCGALGIIAWGGLLLKEPIMARKLMSLASVTVFPTLAFLMIVSEKPRNIKESIIGLIKMTAISMIGATMMVGLLADKLFMLKLDQFVGVKAAHVLPLVLIPLLIFIFNGRPIKTVKNLLEKSIDYKYAILAGLALAGLAVYVIRTGNEGTALVSGLEEQLRSGLKDVLGVRPRTKEFLIGHPFTLLILYFGLNNKNWFLILPAIIGQVSLVNTYAHIHTPLIISLIRSFNGLWIGVLLGVGMIVFTKYLLRYWEASDES
ncbi:MAG: DUF5693 family protein [Bacillota bacterium]